MDDLEKKYHHLIEQLKDCQSLLVAFSGGVDSTFLAYAAYQALGEKALAVTVVSSLNPVGEPERAGELAKTIGIRHRYFQSQPLDDPRVAENSPDRCYYCKRNLFQALSALAFEENIRRVADGENMDDMAVRRPGSRAVQELGIISPLKDAGLTKNEIRNLSRQFNLSTWDHPSMACLATRFPYGTPLDAESLRRVGEAESCLGQLGFSQLRLRHHGNLARVELLPAEFHLVERHRSRMIELLKNSGYQYVCIDLEGYRFGSADEAVGRN